VSDGEVDPVSRSLTPRECKQFLFRRWVIVIGQSCIMIINHSTRRRPDETRAEYELCRRLILNGAAAAAGSVWKEAAVFFPPTGGIQRVVLFPETSGIDNVRLMQAELS